MRLWTIHPKYLDAKGLVALWREALLAQKVLQGETRGYKNHPQLERFKSQQDPLAAVGSYLEAVAREGERRGYAFKREKIAKAGISTRIPVTKGQVQFEWQHLKAKLHRRDPNRFQELETIAEPDVHPLFVTVEGKVEPWERGDIPQG